MSTAPSLRKPFFSLAKSTKISADAFIRGAGLNILLVIASGVLASFMFPPREVWWFGWVYLVPLLIALRRTSAPRIAGWLMLLFGISFLAATLTWLNTIFSVSVVGIYLLASLPWLVFGIAYRSLVGAVAGWRRKILAGVVVAILAPVFWLGVEWFRCEGWYFQFSWAQFGFSLASCRHGGVLYPYLGVYGVTFLIMLVNAVLAEVLVARVHWGARLALVANVAAVITPLTLYLNRPIGIPVEPGERTSAFRVLVVQDESSDLACLREKTFRLQHRKPTLIVWPEYAVTDYPLETPLILKELQRIARTMHSTLVLGTKEHLPEHTRVDWVRRRAMMITEGTLFANAALVIGPDGAVLGTYHKTHPIQFFADGVPGRRYPTFATDAGRLGIAICYDLDFASTFRTLTQNGAEVLVAPTYDASTWTDVQHDQHACMAQARAAENGRWLIRATSSGVSQVIDPSGFVNAVIWNGEETSTMGIAVPHREQTLYVRMLYRLPYLCVALTLAWCLWLLGAGLVCRLRARRCMPCDRQVTTFAHD